MNGLGALYPLGGDSFNSARRRAFVRDPTLELLMLPAQRVATLLVCVFIGSLSSLCAGGDKGLSRAPLPEGLIAPGTKVTAAAGVCFLEGPAVDAQGNVFFSDIAGNRILKLNPAGAVS